LTEEIPIVRLEQGGEVVLVAFSQDARARLDWTTKGKRGIYGLAVIDGFLDTIIAVRIVSETGQHQCWVRTLFPDSKGQRTYF